MICMCSSHGARHGALKAAASRQARPWREVEPVWLEIVPLSEHLDKICYVLIHLNVCEGHLARLEPGSYSIMLHASFDYSS